MRLGILCAKYNRKKAHTHTQIFNKIRGNNASVMWMNVVVGWRGEIGAEQKNSKWYLDNSISNEKVNGTNGASIQPFSHSPCPDPPAFVLQCCRFFAAPFTNCVSCWLCNVNIHGMHWNDSCQHTANNTHAHTNTLTYIIFAECKSLISSLSGAHAGYIACIRNYCDDSSICENAMWCDELSMHFVRTTSEF